jgi:uncharacterized protein (DUF433 family)
MDYELLDQLRNELFKAMLLQDYDNIARLERAIHCVEGRIQLENAKKEIAA